MRYDAHNLAQKTLGITMRPRRWHYLGTWHQWGTTRMHDSPRHGVVDRDCKIHGMTNLYVAGSSVLPTYGANFPTFAIVALGLTGC
jgi:choline dehydrogenase-like flavoprotein